VNCQLNPLAAANASTISFATLSASSRRGDFSNVILNAHQSAGVAGRVIPASSPLAVLLAFLPVGFPWCHVRVDHTQSTVSQLLWRIDWRRPDSLSSVRPDSLHHFRRRGKPGFAFSSRHPVSTDMQVGAVGFHGLIEQLVSGLHGGSFPQSGICCEYFIVPYIFPSEHGRMKPSYNGPRMKFQHVEFIVTYFKTAGMNASASSGSPMPRSSSRSVRWPNGFGFRPSLWGTMIGAFANVSKT